MEVVKLRKCPNKLSESKSSERRTTILSLCGKIHRHKKQPLKKYEKLPLQDVPFCLLLPLEPGDLSQKHNDTYCKREMIERAFSTSVFSEFDLINMIDNLKISLAGLLATSDSTATSSDIEVTLLREKDRLVNKRLVVDVMILQ